MVLSNALAKGRAVAARRREGTLVIAGDTEVVVDGRVVGQPAFEGEARWCLETLSGRSHEVLGALALIGPDKVDGELTVRTGVETSRVTFAKLGPQMIDRYLASEEWRGRAGGYAVQGLGSALVDGIEGDVSNVIGLPVGLLLELAPDLDGAIAAGFFRPFWAFRASRYFGLTDELPRLNKPCARHGCRPRDRQHPRLRPGPGNRPL